MIARRNKLFTVVIENSSCLHAKKKSDRKMKKNQNYETFYRLIILKLLIDMDAKGNKLQSKTQINIFKKTKVIKL